MLEKTFSAGCPGLQRRIIAIDRFQLKHAFPVKSCAKSVGAIRRESHTLLSEHVIDGS